MAEHKQPVAEDLSRMEGEYGAKMIGKLKQMHILIIGLRGLGVETAKNLILAGPHTVSVHDERTAVVADMGANFYLDKKEIGKTRAEAIIHQLGNLNPNVNVHIVKQITEQELKKYQVVVVTDHYPQNLLAQWNDICHHHTEPIAFIAAAIDGACAHVFSDFGPHHVVFDDNGVPAKSIVIDHISNAKNGVVEIDGDRHLLNDGDLIKIEEVLGMSEPKHSSAPTSDEDDQKYTPITDVVTDINGVFEIKTTKNPKKFLIGDTTKLGTYISGGLGTQIKKHLVHKYKTFTETLTNPPFCQGYMDFSKFGRDAQLHIARLALYRFQSTSHRLPRLHDNNDADTMVTLAKTIVEEHKKVAEQKQEALVVDVEEDIIRKVSYYAETELTALAALFGGVVAQEITKQAGKYTPIDQWLHFDAFELLDDTVPVDGKPVGSRYDHQIAVFGKHFQDQLEKQKVFLVGCGALGCEYIKGIALMGLGIRGGAVHMTDDDRIELSNLSRQFLFRRKHVGHPKSKSAAEAALEMNPELAPVLKAHEIRVEPKTEDVFDDTFWDGLDFVLNALDNQIARKYTDSKCVLHNKPLFESGTLGTQANSVICLPHKTPSYSEGAVAGEEQGIAKCTLRNFPSDVIHCIEWAREKFDDLFVSGADLTNSLLEDRTGFFQKLKQDPLSEADSLKAAKNWLDLSASPSFETCVKLLFDEFLTNFRNGINDLTHNFPKDARNIDKETKADLGPFWHGHKRFPQSAEFTAQDELHVDYIYHGANIMASVFGLPEKSRDEVRAMVAKLKADPWVYTGAAVDLSEGDKKEAPAEVKVDEEDAQVIQRLTQYLSSLDLSKYRPLAPADFEKDNDANHHIDFITAATNLRAWNYFIKPATRQKARMVAGRIIPAIATTTACITGFIEIEIYKYVKSVPLEKHRAATINLATNTFVCENLPDPLYRKSGMDPQTYMPVVAIPEKFTCWDLITIDAPALTMEQFFEEFKRVHHGCVIDMLATPSGQVLYNSVDLYGDQKSKVEARLKRPLMDVYTEIAGKIFPPSRNYVLFESTVEDESGDAGIVPMIKYIFKH